jgi:hypothetical protein
VGRESVPRIDDAIAQALKQIPERPDDSASREAKQRYSQKVSEVLAVAIGKELRLRGLKEARPAEPGEFDLSGAERRMAGGIGAKKVDVTWATEESGLLLGISIKGINFRDNKTRNFQKNLTNRRGDLLIESVTLHRRFPYAVLAGLFFLNADAALDGTDRRKSTFDNAHSRMKLFTGRNDPAGRDEQFERLYVMLLSATPFSSSVRPFEVGKPESPVTICQLLDDLLRMVAERNPDFYDYEHGYQGGSLTRVTS